MVTVMANPTAMAKDAADTMAMETAMVQAMVAMETALVDMEMVTIKQ
jgi:hypothetical protein